MFQKENLRVVRKLIRSLSFELRAFKNNSPEVLQFIEELDNVNFSLTHSETSAINLSNKIKTLLKSSYSDVSQYQINSLTIEKIENFNWLNIYNGIKSNKSHIDGMFASRLLGLDGYYVSNRISIGLMLILPGVIYPFHTHSVKEFYYCLSGKLFIQHDIDGEMFSLGEGEISITPEGTLHSLEVIGNRPVLLIYSWLGDLHAPIRIWQKINVNRWEGYKWRRLPGQKWKKSDIKQLSNKAFFDEFGNYS